jgi:hypothetical protein
VQTRERGEVTIDRDITLDDVERGLGDLGEWLPYVGIDELPAAVTPFLSPPGLFASGAVALFVGVFLYWCVSDWRKRRKGAWASGRKKAGKGG